MPNQNQAKPGDIVQIEENGAIWIGTVIQSGFVHRDLDSDSYRESLLLGEGTGVYTPGATKLLSHAEEKLAILLVVAEFGLMYGHYSFIDNNVRILIRANLTHQYSKCTIKLM